MFKILINLCILLCILTINTPVNAEITLKHKNGYNIPKDIIGSYSYKKDELVSNLNISKYFYLDNPSISPSYFISIFFRTNISSIDFNTNINKGDTVNLVFYDSNGNVQNVKSLVVLNKGLSPGSTSFWLSLIAEADLTNFICQSNALVIEFTGNAQVLRIPLSSIEFAEWKQVAATVTKAQIE